MCFKAISVYTSDIGFSERTHLKHVHRKAVTRHVSIKLSSLSCHIVLKLSNTQVYVKNTRAAKTQSLCL